MSSSRASFSLTSCLTFSSSLNVFSNVRSQSLVHHGISYPPLRRVSEVQDSISDRLQSIPKWIVFSADGTTLLGCMDAVLFLRKPADFEPVEWQRYEGVFRIEPGASSRLRTARGNCVGQPESALLKAVPLGRRAKGCGSGLSLRGRTP
jgi:hypothetical protein